MRQAFVILCVTLGILLFSGCDQLTATTQAVGLLTLTPNLATADGMDPNLVEILPLDDVDQQFTAAFVAVAERESVTSTKAPTGVADATVVLEWDGSNAELCELAAEAAGTYGATSLGTDSSNGCSESGLSYVAGTSYSTQISTDADLYTIRVTAPTPISTDKVEFDPKPAEPESDSGLQLRKHPLNTKLVIDWSKDVEASSRNTFATMMRLNFKGDTSDPLTAAQDALKATNWEADPNNPIFDNFPREAKEMISLVLDEPAHKVTIPDSTFNEQGMYLLVLTSTELSTDTSTNLSLGSGALAGSGTAWVFWVE